MLTLVGQNRQRSWFEVEHLTVWRQNCMQKFGTEAFFWATSRPPNSSFTSTQWDIISFSWLQCITKLMNSTVSHAALQWLVEHESKIRFFIFSFNKHTVRWGQPASTLGDSQSNPHVCDGCGSGIFRPAGASDDWSCWTTTGNSFLSLNKSKQWMKEGRKIKHQMRSYQRYRNGKDSCSFIGDIFG